MDIVYDASFAKDLGPYRLSQKVLGIKNVELQL